MSDLPHFESFEELWPHFVRAHSKWGNRMLHVAGTTLGAVSLLYGIGKRRPGFVLLAPLIGYGVAWAGHYFIEGNRPATFTYPLWTLRADFRMVGKIFAGTMDEEIERVMREEREQSNGKSGRDFDDEARPSGDVN